MEAFLITLCLALLVFIIVKTNDIIQKIESLTKEVRGLKKDHIKIIENVSELGAILESIKSTLAYTSKEIVVENKSIVPQNLPKEQPLPTVDVPNQIVVEFPSAESILSDVTSDTEQKSPDFVTETPTIPSETKKEILQPVENFAENTYSKENQFVPPIPKKKAKEGINWEKFVGENLINKIGIAILTIGIGIFVKFAIDKNWINELGRVLIALGSGAALLAFGHYLRKEYKSFSSVLIGGGIVVLYFTIGLAFHLYHMFDQTTAFVLMVMITSFSVALSIVYDRIEIAVIALIGGFGTPFMVSTGEGNYVILFTYLIILTIGMLTLAFFRKWNLVYLVAYGFTLLIFGAWAIDQSSGKSLGGLCFATAFYILFFLAATIFNIRKSEKFIAFDYIVLFSLNLAYFSVGIYFVKQINEGLYLGLFTSLVSIFNFVFAYVLYKRKDIDKNFIYLLICIVLTYITLIAPIQLKGNQITLFWAAESVILLWLSQRSGITLLKTGSILLTPLSFISLAIDWVNIYWENVDYLKPMWPLANPGFLAGLGVTVSLILLQRLWVKEYVEQKTGERMLTMQEVIPLATICIGYLTGFFEINYQFNVISGVDYGNELAILALMIYSVVCLLLFFYTIAKHPLDFQKVIFIGITCIVSVIYVFVFNPSTITLRNYTIDNSISSWQYYFHYTYLPLYFICIYKSTGYIKENYPHQLHRFIWFFGIIGVYVISSELDHLAVTIGAENRSDVYYIVQFDQMVFYPIAWGITSFVLMIVGMRQKMKSLRIFSLSLFGLILLKLFILDFGEMSEGGRIAAFISLGILLLVMSFLYQKLKKLLFDTEEEK